MSQHQKEHRASLSRSKPRQIVQVISDSTEEYALDPFREVCERVLNLPPLQVLEITLPVNCVEEALVRSVVHNRALNVRVLEELLASREHLLPPPIQDGRLQLVKLDVFALLIPQFNCGLVLQHGLGGRVPFILQVLCD